ncbi:MAG: hypothetical protein N2112_07050 [Gemmataceae bacterium]|nr:hypothetical protein [Gemmataceae bacterium]
MRLFYLLPMCLFVVMNQSLFAQALSAEELPSQPVSDSLTDSPIFLSSYHHHKSLPLGSNPSRPSTSPTFSKENDCPPSSERGYRYLPEQNPEAIPDQKIIYMDPPSTFIPQLWYSAEYWWLFMRDFGGVQRDNGNGLRTVVALWLDDDRKNGLGLELDYIRDTGAQGLISAPLDMFSIFPYYRRMITARETFQSEFVLGYRYLNLTEKRFDPTLGVNYRADNDFHLLQGGLYTKFIFEKWFLLSSTNWAIGYLNYSQNFNGSRLDGNGFRWLSDSNTMLGYKINKSFGVTVGYQMITIQQIARIDLFGEKANLMLHGITFGVYGQY